jgi:hypothetical protein
LDVGDVPDLARFCPRRGNPKHLNIHDLSMEEIRKLDLRSTVKPDGTIILYEDYIKKTTPEQRKALQKEIKGTGKTVINPKRGAPKRIRPTGGTVRTEQMIGSDRESKVTDRLNPYSAIGLVATSFPSGFSFARGN